MDCLVEKVRAIVEEPDTLVTLMAEQSTDFSGRVAMIYEEWEKLSGSTTVGSLGSADAASTVLI